jgi:hypothetical protein
MRILPLACAILLAGVGLGTVGCQHSLSPEDRKKLDEFNTTFSKLQQTTDQLAKEGLVKAADAVDPLGIKLLLKKIEDQQQTIQSQKQEIESLRGQLTGKNGVAGRLTVVEETFRKIDGDWVRPGGIRAGSIQLLPADELLVTFHEGALKGQSLKGRWEGVNTFCVPNANICATVLGPRYILWHSAINDASWLR